MMRWRYLSAASLIADVALGCTITLPVTVLSSSPPVTTLMLSSSLLIEILLDFTCHHVVEVVLGYNSSVGLMVVFNRYKQSLDHSRLDVFLGYPRATVPQRVLT